MYRRSYTRAIEDRSQPANSYPLNATALLLFALRAYRNWPRGLLRLVGVTYEVINAAVNYEASQEDWRVSRRVREPWKDFRAARAAFLWHLDAQ